MKIKLWLASTALAFSFNAFAGTCSFDIAVMDALKFSKPSITISKSKCDKVTINLMHIGKLPKTTMGHNWVLTKSTDVEAAALAGQMAGVASNFVLMGDKRIIASTKIIGGGESTSITFDTKMLMTGGGYTYFCSFPGHHYIMKGMFIVNP
ncbi:azurin [Parashewanella curva]|uniref:Azurin n=1 Tax=Parashewanella curva TaxID=2338552 RepID=A0A3L8PXS0_9GAMM|nr:azurin [Parashewanella curva]RLV60120.1 azurin [Parashewanella curva]